MRVKLVLLVLAAVMIAMLVVVPGSGASSNIKLAVYGVDGTANTTGTGNCLDCVFFSSATGSATCTLCASGKPSGGSFSLSLPTITTYPPSPCKVKTIGGTLSMTWDNTLVSTASVSGKFTDGKPILTLSGTLPSGDAQWPNDQIKIVLNNYPPSPCTTATQAVTGALTISG